MAPTGLKVRSALVSTWFNAAILLFRHRKVQVLPLRPFVGWLTDQRREFASWNAFAETLRYEWPLRRLNCCSASLLLAGSPTASASSAAMTLEPHSLAYTAVNSAPNNKIWDE